MNLGRWGHKGCKDRKVLPGHRELQAQQVRRVYKVPKAQWDRQDLSVPPAQRL